MPVVISGTHFLHSLCRKCHKEFEHIFRARDLLRPHIFNELAFKCPDCGATEFDPISPKGKYTLEEWKQMHPDLDLESLPDYSYPENE